jgi:hypothetical protein
MELTSSLSHLKGCSSYSKLLWFGFGIKHIVNDLSATEEGAICVAISAALAVPYTAFQAAHVWRELCMLKDAPRHLNPSIHQWSALVEVSAGSLNRSKFPIYFETFSRFLVPQIRDLRAPAPAKDIAKALATLADLSRGTLVSCVFIGGVECAWLAAVAEILLRLNIEIQDQHGQCIHRSNKSMESGSVQAYFRRESNRSVTYPGEIIQRVCFISKGEDLLKERIWSTSPAIQNPTSWSSVFSDTFSDWSRFKDSASRFHFTNLLACVAMHSREYFSSETTLGQHQYSQWWLRFYSQGCLYHPNGSADKILKFARDHLPEIPLPDDIDSLAQLSPTQTLEKMDVSVRGLEAICQCRFCGVNGKRDSSDRRSCLKRLAFTVIRFLLILSPVTVHSHIPPSTTALWQLYNCTIENLGDCTRVPFPCKGVQLVLFLFTGRLPARNVPDHVSAVSTGGVCVFLTILKDINLSLLDAMKITIIPGHIRHEDHVYTFITDTAIDLPFHKLQGSVDGQEARPHLPNLAGYQFELVVEEQEDKNTLGASHKSIHSGEQDLCVRPEALQESLRSCLRTDIHHVETCDMSVGIEAGGHHWSFHDRTSRSSSEPIPSSAMLSTSSWSILTWNAWELSGDDILQWLDIEILMPDNVALFILAQDLSSRHAIESSWNGRNRIFIARFEDCPRCLVQVAAFAWQRIDAKKPSPPPIVEINEFKKQGIIKFAVSRHDKGREDILFELRPAPRRKSPSRSSRRSWKIFR